LKPALPTFPSDPYPVIQSQHGKLSAYPDSVQIMQKLKAEGYLIGVASRSPTPDVAWKAVDAFGWRTYFDHAEVYPGQKTTHFQRYTKLWSERSQCFNFFSCEGG
jgi:magnesium-dependent phosphatase 1